MSSHRDLDVIVVGGGLVGSAIAYGLAREGVSVAVIDEGDVALRAARANFGLVWVQGKGDGMVEYVRWTLRSMRAWPGFMRELQETTGIHVAYERPGGVHPCLSATEIGERERLIGRLKAQFAPDDYECELHDHAGLRRYVPGLGQRVVGGSYSPYDGHCNPLKLLRALHGAMLAHGAEYLPERKVDRIAHAGGAFRISTAREELAAAKVVLACGLGNRALGEQLDLRVPVAPERGQIVVTERAERLLDLPILTIRQTDEGTVLLGDSHENVGLDTAATAPVMSEIAARSIAMLPALEKLRMVRAWACLRVMAPDGFPIYDESKTFPGAFVANCHSAVTLAAVHADAMPKWIMHGETPDWFGRFSGARFHV